MCEAVMESSLGTSLRQRNPEKKSAQGLPEVSARLKDANGKEMKFEDVVKSAEQAAVLVLVY